LLLAVSRTYTLKQLGYLAQETGPICSTFRVLLKVSHYIRVRQFDVNCTGVMPVQLTSNWLTLKVPAPPVHLLFQLNRKMHSWRSVLRLFCLSVHVSVKLEHCKHITPMVAPLSKFFNDNIRMVATQVLHQQCALDVLYSFILFDVEFNEGRSVPNITQVGSRTVGWVDDGIPGLLMNIAILESLLYPRQKTQLEWLFTAFSCLASLNPEVVSDIYSWS